jgi:hypothetical protein
MVGSTRCPLRFLPVLAVLLAGCSMRPLPESFPLNFARASTYDIVQHVRCEVKEGLLRVRNTIGRGKRKDQVEAIIAATSIGYDFEFTMTEDAGSDGGVGFSRNSSNKSSKATSAVGVTTEAQRTRRNIRAFTIVEELGDIARADCPAEKAGANLAYPISGSLNVAEIVRTYMQLEIISNFAPLEGDDAELVSDVLEGAGSREKKRTGVFAEHIEFQTTISGDASPTLHLSTVGGGLRLTNASVGSMVSRTDAHSVIMAFAQDTDFKDPKVPKRSAKADAKAMTAKYERFRMLAAKDVRVPRTTTTLVQASADARNKLVLELARLRNLRNDELEGAKFLGRQLLRFLRPPEESGPDD